jgi:hypothetical protein
LAKKTANTARRSKGGSPAIENRYVENRKKSDELIKHADAVVREAQEVIKTTRELLLESASLRRGSSRQTD